MTRMENYYREKKQGNKMKAELNVHLFKEYFYVSYR